jgi:predicted nucleotidyltransferase
MTEPAERGHVVERFTEICARDERIVAAFVGGSVARGASDRFSDLDLCVVASDDAFAAVAAERSTIIEALGMPLFCQDWGDEDPVLFAILADGTEVELHCIAEGRLEQAQVGPIRPLLDRGGILVGLELPVRPPGRDDLRADCRRILAWFWHDVAHTVAALGRDQLWWAHGQVEALRGSCVNLIRVTQGSRANDEAYWKIEEEISVGPLEPLTTTIVPRERVALARATVELVRFFGVHGREAAQRYDLPYPDELERLLLRDLDAVAES